MKLARRVASDNTSQTDFIISEHSPLDLLPTDHVRILHPVGGLPRRVVSFAAASGKKWHERVIPLADLERYAAHLDGASNQFMSQNSFWGKRCNAQLATLGACYVDLDYHKTKKWANASPEVVCNAALTQLDDLDMPEPSYAVSTGRGAALVWLLTPTSRKALSRWMAVQRKLGQALHGFGADMAALDAARVLRVIGSVNSKSGQTVRAVYTSGPMDRLARYQFDEFANEVLPLSRDKLAEVISLRVAKAKQRAEGKVFRPVTELNGGTYWEAVLTDLQSLRRLRWFGDLPPGQRDLWTFLAGNAMTWLTPFGASLQRELNQLALEAGGWWDDAEVRTRLSSLFTRFQMARDGQTIEWEGKQVDPRLRYRKDTIIDQLAITPDEMREGGLRVLVDDAVKREIDRAKKRTARGSDAKQQTKAQAREQARVMAAAGATQAEIGAVLGVSQVTVGRWLKS